MKLNSLALFLVRPNQLLLFASLAATIAAGVSEASDPLERARSPLYRVTLEKAVGELTEPADEPVASQQVHPAAWEAPGDGANAPAAVMVTNDPSAATGCVVGGNTYKCTTSPAPGGTQCAAGSNTCCATDGACVPTTKPPWRWTLCRGANTMCRNNQQVYCTQQPIHPTQCINSNTFCPRSDPNCFTFLPAGNTMCQGMQTTCPTPRGGGQFVCTRDPMSSTQCAHSSRTNCGPADPICAPSGLAPAGDGAEKAHDENPGTDPLCFLSPNSGFSGTTMTVALYCVDTYLVQGEMHATFGDGIEVIAYDVTSSTESAATIYIYPGAPVGPRLVLVHGGDNPAGSPPAWGEFAVAVGLFFVTDGTIDVDEPSAPGAPVKLLSAPNPFSASTSIQYTLPQAGRVQVMVFDAGGSLVRRLEDGERVAGDHTVEWDGRDESQSRLPSGVYFVVLKTAQESVAWKTVLRE